MRNSCLFPGPNEKPILESNIIIMLIVFYAWTVMFEYALLPMILVRSQINNMLGGETGKNVPE